MDQLVIIKNGKAVTDSLIVAEEFDKTHDHVTRDIRLQIEKLNEAGESEWGVANFGETQYQHPQNQQWYTKFNLTEDAFALVAMSYVTPKAMKMKVKFLAEFKRMREQLNQQPKTHLEILQASIAQLVEQERRLANVENRMAATEQKISAQSELLALHPTEWRKKVTHILNKIAQARGSYGAYQDVRSESYQLLIERAKCDLARRLTNRKQKMALEGVVKSKIDKVNNLDVIADDAKLVEIYLAVVKEMAIKHQISLDAEDKPAHESPVIHHEQHG